ncbi:MAG: flagellar export chaperone FlgN [Deltaproteobacteria bacterium]|nr:flagellar export chaperone FlgN [Deltaproteobacteria bacterium]
MNTHTNTTENPANGHGYIPRLRELLLAHVKLSTDFCSLLEDEKKALVKMNIPILAELVRKKDRELARIQRLDENIQEVSSRITLKDRKKKNVSAVKLLDTIPFLSADGQDMVLTYQKKLSLLRNNILTANHVNQRFASDTLGYINDAVSFICNGITSETLYNPARQEHRGKSLPALVSREV